MKLIADHIYRQKQVDDFTKDLIRNSVKIMLNKSFDVEEDISHEEVSRLINEARMPFDLCWFEFEDMNYAVCIDSREFPDRYIWYWFQKTAKGYFKHEITLEDNFNNSTVQAFIWGMKESPYYRIKNLKIVETNDRNATPDVLKNIENLHISSVATTISILYILEALQCSNVDLENTKPEKKLAKAHKKKFGVPLFTYKTLVIKTSKKQAASQGQSEKGGWTQRLHFRRGHIRTYKSGKKIYIAPYMAGSAEKGTIVKDYKIE